MNSIYNFSIKESNGELVTLGKYKGKVLLIVNTASNCGFTPQYQELEQLYKMYRDQGLEILGFPCNQFLNQEPNDISKIVSFCTLNYGVSFPILDKVNVNGAHEHPLFGKLKADARGVLGSKSIKWNFTKFLVGKDGKIIKRYSPFFAPVKLSTDIKQALEVII